MDTTLEARLVELELRYTQQSDLVEQLSDVLYAQQRRIDALEAEVRRLRQDLGAGGGSHEPMPHERPPHY